MRIGSGGMADVYEGVDTRLRRSVAVKVFRPGPDPQIEDRLTAEAVLLGRLQHPGLVTVYDAGRDDDRTYLVMQLVKGPTLRSLLAGGALPEQDVIRVGAALARALAYVHRAGIVHRDVKPSNVLLDAAGDPHLADFGIARLANATRHTAPDVLIGTAAYLAPEQVTGRRVGPAVDVYALGLVLLEALKGELEYEGTPLEAALARLHRPPEVPTWLPPDLATLLRAMTAHDPDARPDTDSCADILASRHAGATAHPLPLSTSSEASLPASWAARPDAGEPVRAEEVAVTRPNLAIGPRHSRRRAVGTAIAALSVALGTTLTVATATNGSDRAQAASPHVPPVHQPSRTATPESRSGALPPVGSHHARPTSRTIDTSGPAAAATGFHAEPAARTFVASGAAATPTGSHTKPPSKGPASSHPTAPKHRAPAWHHGAESRKPTQHHPRNADDHTRHTEHGGPKPKP
ncbi:protein kinase [Streptomyces sp. NPDC093261]|uniref:serine/threonine-protein kinase n=1 Tax=Streptomyces sp. NPDC093261 TaxID=3366037 RepID=UPI0038127361